jgi:hypothetical protein
MSTCVEHIIAVNLAEKSAPTLEDCRSDTIIPARMKTWKDVYRPLRVSDYVLDCVGFVCETAIRDLSGPKGDAIATGFLVKVRSLVRGYGYLYFVTAKHVATDLKDIDVHILINKRGGGTTELLPCDPPTWYLHPSDPTTDIAVVPVIPNQSAEFNAIPMEHMLTPEGVKELSVGIGDEVYSVGLFTEIDNTERNIPILRHGNISMMPTQQIQTGLGYADAYLIEARSIGGISGSPVFVRPTGHLPFGVHPDGTPQTIMGVVDRTQLLGVVHGHWDVKESEINQFPVTHDRKRGVNYGIAIVIPAIKLIETLNRRELSETRMRHEEELKKRGIPGMDSVTFTSS